MDNFKKQFSNNLKQLRMFRNLTQEQLAELIGVSPKTLSYWENGHNTISFNKLPIIAKALDIPVYRLFVFDNVSSNNVSDLIGTLDDKSRKVVYEIIKLLMSK